MIAIVVVGLTSCGGDYAKFLDLAKEAKCNMTGLEEQSKENPDDYQLIEQIARERRAIDNWAELSGDQAAFLKEVQGHTCK